MGFSCWSYKKPEHIKRENVPKGRWCQRGKRWKSGGKGMSGKSKLAGVVKEREISMRSRYLSLDRICSREFGSVLTSQVMAVLS